MEVVRTVSGRRKILAVTDKLKSYEAVKNGMLKSVEQRQHKGLNNRRCIMDI